MKRFLPLLLIGFALFLSACNMSLAEDVTPPPNYIPPTAAPTLGPLHPASTPNLANGAAIYSTECAPCHGESGLGDGPMNKQLAVPVAAIGLPSIAQKASPADWFIIVSQGNMARMMPPFSNALSEQERWDVVAYALSLHASPEALDQGRQAIEKNCPACDLGFFEDQERMASLSDDDLLGLMVQGGDSFPAFGADLTEEELYNAAAYLRSLTFSASPAATPVSATPTPAAAEDGYPNPSEALPASDGGSVHGSILLTNGNPPDGITVTLRGFDHAMDASGPQQVLTLTATPGADGSLLFEGVELPKNRILLIEAEYLGIIYQSDMYVVEEGASEVTFAPLTLYETSEDMNALTLSQGHIFLDVLEDRVQIVEFFNLVNSTGTSILVPVSNDMMAIAKMPPGTTSLGYDAQQGAVSPVDAPGGFAIPPSEQSYGLVAGFEMAYDSSAEIEIPFVLGMPATSSIFVPVGVTLKGEGLVDMGQQDIGEGTIYQVYGFGPLPAGGSLTVQMSGRPKTDGGTETAVNAQQLVTIGAGALGLLLIGLGVWLYLRDRKRNESVDEEDEDQGEFEDANSVLDAIIAIDDLHRAGKLPPEAYQKRRAELKELYKKLESRE
ncbi:MAG: c-type cytochrome [Chloroflexota bacterium]